MKLGPLAEAALLLLSAWTVDISATDIPKTRKLLTTTQLSNGANLAVDIQSPEHGTLVPLDSQCEASVTISGETSIGQGTPDVTYIFVLDKSGSLTSNEVAAMKEFFIDLTSIVFDEGSAVNAGVIFFDSTANIIQDLTDDQAAIVSAISTLSDSGGTDCAAGLLEAAVLATRVSAGGTVITLIAGDGECNEANSALNAAATALEDLGVIVETLAVFDSVDCSGLLGTIPRNGGTCNDIDVPSDYSITSLIGTTLKGTMIKQDSGSYVPLDTIPLGDQDGPASKTFSVTVPIAGLSSTICIKAIGEDSLGGDAVVEECITVGVEDESESTALASCEPFDKSASDNEANAGGFFVIGNGESCLVSYYEVVDTGSGEAFGPFAAGTVFKYTKARGSDPNIDVGSGKVDWRIRGNGDAVVRAVDIYGNTGTAPCLRGETNH